jgi:chorismate mutase
MSIESRKDSKAARRALHVCARVIVTATKMNPEQGMRHVSLRKRLMENKPAAHRKENWL